MNFPLTKIAYKTVGENLKRYDLGEHSEKYLFQTGVRMSGRPNKFWMDIISWKSKSREIRILK